MVFVASALGPQTADPQARAMVKAIRDHNHAAFLKLLNSGVKPIGAYKGHPFIETAGGSGDAFILRTLLERGANPNAAGAHGFTALSLATFSGSLARMKILLRAGALVNARDKLGGATALFNAGSCPVGKLLLDHGAKLNIKITDGQTVLHGWVCEGDPNLVRLALERGAKVNAVDKLLDTPLLALVAQADRDHFDSTSERFGGQKPPPWVKESHARYLRDVKIAQMLIEHGADPWQRNSHDTSAASYAESRKLNELSAVLTRRRKHRL